MPPLQSKLELALDASRAVDVLDAAARETGSVVAWVDEVTRAVDALLPSPLGFAALLVEIQGQGGKIVHVTPSPTMSDELLAYTDLRMQERAIFEPFYLDSQHVNTMADIRPHLTDDAQRATAWSMETLQAQDFLGLVTRTEATHSLAIIGIRPQRESLSTRVRLALGRIALHIEAGLRMRLDPMSIVAVLHPDGRFAHAEAEARSRPVQERLGAHARNIDRARLRRHRADPSTLDGWSALVAGRYGFVERHGSQREYLVYANSSQTARTRAWSPAEARAVELSAAGMPGKLVTYALGVSSGEVSRLLAKAAAKVGVASRTELVGLAALIRMRGAKRDDALRARGLSDGERAVLTLLQRGLSNEEIATHRGTSPRTVANQVAAVLRKTRCPSRRALATLGP